MYVLVFQCEDVSQLSTMLWHLPRRHWPINITQRWRTGDLDDILILLVSIDHRPTHPPTDRPTSHLGKFQMPISPQGVVRSTSCLVLRWRFRDRRNGAISGL